jgi:hypothetical protein
MVSQSNVGRVHLYIRETDYETEYPRLAPHEREATRESMLLLVEAASESL